MAIWVLVAVGGMAAAGATAFAAVRSARRRRDGRHSRPRGANVSSRRLGVASALAVVVALIAVVLAFQQPGSDEPPVAVPTAQPYYIEISDSGVPLAIEADPTEEEPQTEGEGEVEATAAPGGTAARTPAPTRAPAAATPRPAAPAPAPTATPQPTPTPTPTPPPVPGPNVAASTSCFQQGQGSVASINYSVNARQPATLTSVHLYLDGRLVQQPGVAGRGSHSGSHSGAVSGGQHAYTLVATQSDGGTTTRSYPVCI